MIAPSAAEWTALALSVKVSLAATAAIALPGAWLGWLFARKRFPGKTLVESLVYAPLVLPPVVTGYLLLQVFGRGGLLGRWLHDRLPLAFTWEGAALAAGVVALPLLVRSVRASVEVVDRNLEEAAATLGAGPVRTALAVTAPLAAPGFVAGAFLAFARALGEFGATVVFAGNIVGETRTLPLAIFTEMQTPGGDEAALRLVAISVALSILAVAGSEILARRLQRRVDPRA